MEQLFVYGNCVKQGLRVLVHLVLADGGALAESGIQDLFADPQALGRNLQKFIGVDEIQRLLQAEDPGRRQGQRFVREEERVLVRCFFLHTFSSMSSAREHCPTTMPE